MIRTIALFDYSNLAGLCFQSGRRPDVFALRDRIADAEDRLLVDTYVYAPTPRNNNTGVLRFHEALRRRGMQVITKLAKQRPDGSVKADMDSSMIVDAMELAYRARPDLMILATGDSDFEPLATALRRQGIQVEVASAPGACPSSSVMPRLGSSTCLTGS